MADPAYNFLEDRIHAVPDELLTQRLFEVLQRLAGRPLGGLVGRSEGTARTEDTYVLFETSRRGDRIVARLRIERIPRTIRTYHLLVETKLEVAFRQDKAGAIAGPCEQRQLLHDIEVLDGLGIRLTFGAPA